MVHFIECENVQLFHYRMEGNKEPFVEIQQADIRDALVKLLDKRNHPGELFNSRTRVFLKIMV